MPAACNVSRQRLTFKQKLEVDVYYHGNKVTLSMDEIIRSLRNMGFSTICRKTVRHYASNEDTVLQHIPDDVRNGTLDRYRPAALPELERILVFSLELLVLITTSKATG
ncbi:unnamed protein product [Rhizoctonia solani]|uniref:Uncharacterized protein n=1 Tax=Rhizoctonia solani TaxID=456999 RepID=A0A8H3GPB6_9AGAM|nr:unnamed protein product [Rhizoctonia solani]